RKQVTNFIRMHLSNSNLERFVPGITEYKPKVLWDKIFTYFAAKTFNEGEIEKSMNSFQAAFCRLVEVSSKFDKKSLEAVAVIFALKRLPMSFSVLRQLQFAGFKDENISFDDFLRDLEVEKKRTTTLLL
ncbi:uncharacterized protein VP01_8085g1, partial [Puccinia sorghi]